MTNNNTPATTAQNAVIANAQQKFEIACQTAQGLTTLNNFTAAFQAVTVVNLLREALSDEVMNQVFMPLQNTKVGFLTDHDPKKKNKNGMPAIPYGVDVVRDAIIDAVTNGLLPSGNQFNIIAGRMYPTKEGYTALLKKIGCKYFIEKGFDKSQDSRFAEINCKISYEYQGKKNSFNYVAVVKKDDFSSPDQISGKAERRAKKVLYEYLTGCDLGDADENSGKVVEQSAEIISTTTKAEETAAPATTAEKKKSIFDNVQLG